MGVDWERFRLLADLIGDLTSKPEPPRPRPGETFLRGPIPWGWLAEASRLPGSGFSVAMAVWYIVHRFQRDPRASVAELAECLGAGRTSIKAGLQAAESAGLISVRRDPGRKPVYTLPEIPTDRSKPPPLRGPIPWGWWLAATRLPGPTLRVGAVCWLLAGWRRSGEFELTLGGWADLGLSRYSASRGLESLERAGLVAVVRRPGESPIVKILDGPTRSDPEHGGSVR